MDLNKCEPKATVNVSNLVNKMQSYYKSGGENKRMNHLTKYFDHQDKEARAVLPSRYGNRIPLCLQSNRFNTNSPMTNRPSVLNANTQSDPFGLKRSLQAKKFHHAPPRKKRTANRSKQVMKMPKQLTCSLSEPTLSQSDSFDANCDVDFPAMLYKKMALKQQLFNNNNLNFRYPIKFDKHCKTFVREDPSANDRALLTYNQARALPAKGDDTDGESCSTCHASSTDQNVCVSRHANIRGQTSRQDTNDRKIFRNTPCENFEDQYYTLARYLKEGDDVTRQKTPRQHRLYEIRLKQNDSKMENNNSFQSANVKNARQYYQEPKNNSRMRVTQVEQNGKYKTNNLIPYSRNTRETFKEKVTEEELWQRFDKIFKSYASTRLHSAVVISRAISTSWMKDAGVVNMFMDVDEATDSFKKAAGLKYTMNIHEYKDFLLNLTKRMKLPLYEIYRRMCGF